MEFFKSTSGFCPVCGSIFPPLGLIGNIQCYSCKMEFDPTILGNEEVEYKIHFNTYDPVKVLNKEQQRSKSEPEGPIVDRKCAKCGYNKMSYATLQLRSADEGQTVFFTCVKCKSKETENS